MLGRHNNKEKKVDKLKKYYLWDRSTATLHISCSIGLKPKTCQLLRYICYIQYTYMPVHFFCKIYIMGSREGLTNYWINVHALILRLDWSTNERSLITSDGLVGVIILLAFCAISRNFCCYLWLNIKQYK